MDARTRLLRFFGESGSPRARAEALVKDLEPAVLAEVFVTSAVIAGAAGIAAEQMWLMKKEGKTDFKRALEAAFTDELESLAFLSDLFITASDKKFRSIETAASALAEAATNEARSLADGIPLFSFLTSTIRGMQERTRFELASKANGRISKFTVPMYRAFDALDVVLGLDYDREEGLKADLTSSERKFEGAGKGVQSSYAIILSLLEQLELVSGSRFVDLGSGYGRAGLVIPFARPDLVCAGYEIIGHRVDLANESARRAGISQATSFHTQDLSDRSFAIPEAEVYYMYDPFSRETYEYVIAQLKEHGRKRPIIVVTNGRASDWFTEAVRGDAWTKTWGRDESMLTIFRSVA